MKKSLILLSIFISLNASAAPVYLYPTCTYTSSSGECTLYNSSYEDVSCDINVRGQTHLGGYIRISEYKVLYKGMFAWVQVQALEPEKDPLIYVAANAFCNTLN